MPHVGLRFCGTLADVYVWYVLQVAPKIKERMMEQGTMLIGYQPLGKRVNFFRLVISNLQSTDANMDFVVNEIDRLGADL